ncbi:MAG: hypothetical protein NVSMB57_00890 [Actinomycetota bacterium]
MPIAATITLLVGMAAGLTVVGRAASGSSLSSPGCGGKVGQSMAKVGHAYFVRAGEINVEGEKPVRIESVRSVGSNPAIAAVTFELVDQPEKGPRSMLASERRYSEYVDPAGARLAPGISHHWRLYVVARLKVALPWESSGIELIYRSGWTRRSMTIGCASQLDPGP